MARRRFWRRAFLATIVFGGLFSAYVTWQIVDDRIAKPTFTISPETTIVTEPLRANSTVDYVAAFNAQMKRRVPNDENAVILVFPLAQDLVNSPETVEQIYREWGIPRQDRVPRLESFEQFARRHGSVPTPQFDSDTESSEPAYRRLFDEARRAPWTAKELPLVARWLAANDTSLSAIGVYLFERDGWFMPVVSEYLFDRPTDLALLSDELAQCLIVRANMRIAAGDYQRAMNDIRAVCRLAWMERHGLDFNSQVCAQHLIKRLFEQSPHLLSEPAELPPEALERLAEAVERLSRLTTAQEVYDVAARWHALDLTQFVIFDDTLAAPAATQWLRATRVDVDLAFRIVNEQYNEIVATAHAQPLDVLAGSRSDLWTNVIESAKRKEREIAGVERWLRITGPLLPPRMRATMRGRLVGNIISSSDASSLANIYPTQWRLTTMRLQLVRVAIALAQYHQQHGRYPQKLDAMVPVYLLELPCDCFTGGPLTYSSRDGGYLLYSVGRDGDDDGGESASEDEELDDLAIRIPAEAM